jgi:hypothetical protein
MVRRRQRRDEGGAGGQEAHRERGAHDRGDLVLVDESIGLTADVTVVGPRTIERSVGKAKRVQDLRGTGGTHG